MNADANGEEPKPPVGSDGALPKAGSDEPAPQLGSDAPLLASPGYLLARLGAESRRLWAQMLGARDLTPHHFGVLMTLGQRSPITQRELARVAGIDPRNAVPIIDALERRGFLERRPDPSDRRRHAVVLTPAGRDLMRELQAAGESLEVEMLRDLTDAERRTLTSLLLRVFLSVTEG